MRKFILKIFIILSVLVTVCGTAFAYDFNTQLSKDEVVFKTSTSRINVIDPGVKSVTTNTFPGYRGSNQLIIYTSDFGKKTGTNEFGTEAIVVNGYVTSLSGADSLIPQNGFVISGHGRAKEWINKNITLGSKIIVDPYSMVITSVLTPESFLFAANEKIKEVYSIMKYYAYQNILYDYTTSAEYLKKAKKALIQAAKQKETSQKHSTSAIENANTAIEYSIPYYENELKGVWIRPTEKNQSEITDTLDKLKEAGINNIFLETFYHAKTIYPSNVLKKYGITNQRQEFIGFDPLMTWITEAHKRGIKVNVWFECYYVGNDNPRINPMHILNVYPQWANITKENYTSPYPVSSPNEHNGYFLDPANPSVQDFLLEVIDEIVTKYEPDGINLDYIRYPQTVDKKSSRYESSSWGYTQYARENFKSLHNIDPIDISKDTPEWNLWAQYRQDKVSEFVKQVSEHVRKKMKLTAVIFPDRQRSLDTKMQDWRTWSYRNYIDGFTPLLLSCDYDTAKNLLQDIKNNSAKYTDIYAGIFVSFMNGTTDDMLRQIHMSRQLESKGVIIFEYSHFTKDYINAVSKSAFTPISEKSLKKIKSGEISQLKLQNYLDKSIRDYYLEEIIINQAINKKQQQKNVRPTNYTIQYNNDTAKKQQPQTKIEQIPTNIEQSKKENDVQNETRKKKKRNRKPEKFSPSVEQGNNGRFY